ncbi:MAG: ATP-binding cassette domain-containing protein [Acidobacteria bacterium]|nr:ATP-binding cassette domain-containing protein [Acidobacteriota bacterium]
MPDLDPVVTLEGVTVLYGRHAALRDVSVMFPAGAVGLLGPNSAGKSSMIKALLGLVVPDRGRMRVLGLDVATSAPEIRARVGYMPEIDSHIPRMNAVSFVAYCAELAGLPRVDAMQRAHEMLFYVGLGEARYRNVETYSTGMKQRIKLAQALVHDPHLLFLDEPTNGMDPKGRDEMLELVRDLAHAKGVNVIVSSYLLPDIEYTCGHIVVMDKGRVATEGPIDGLKQPQGQVFELRVKIPANAGMWDGAGMSSGAGISPVVGAAAVAGTPEAHHAPNALTFDSFVERLRVEGLECHETEDDVMRVFVPGVPGEDGARRIFRVAAAERVQIRHLRPSVPTLEDVFAKAVGEK